MGGPNLPTGGLTPDISTGELTNWYAVNATVNAFDVAVRTATAGQVLVHDGTVFAPVHDSSAAIIWYNGATLPLRSTVTSDATRTVFWASPLSYPPPSGGGYAVDGVDFWLVIP